MSGRYQQIRRIQLLIFENFIIRDILVDHQSLGKAFGQIFTMLVILFDKLNTATGTEQKFNNITTDFTTADNNYIMQFMTKTTGLG